MLRRDRGDEIRVDDAALHEVERKGIAVVAQPQFVEVAFGIIQPGCPEDRLAGRTLMREVVDRVADALVLHPELRIDLEEQDGDEGGLPIVAMDDVGPAIRAQHEFQRGS